MAPPSNENPSVVEMEDIEDMLIGSDGAPPGFRLPLMSIGLNPKLRQKKKKKKQDNIPNLKHLTQDIPSNPSPQVPGTQIIYMKTFGCSHNQSDSEYMAGQLSAFGYALSDNPDDVDLWLINTFRLSGAPGDVTRLLSRTDEDLKRYAGHDLAPTHNVPSMSRHPLTGDWYPAINKPAVVLHWLNHAKIDGEYIVIHDADMIMRGPITPWEFNAARGHPVSTPYELLFGWTYGLNQLHKRESNL